MLIEVPKHHKLTKEQFLSAYAKGIKVIDTRNKTVFAEGFIPGSLSIQGNNSFSTWAGCLLNYQEQFMLVAAKDQMDDLIRKLMRIGLDNVYGFISNVEDIGLELKKVDAIPRDEFKTYVDRDVVQIVDVRGLTEFEESCVEGADHCFVGTIQDNLHKINKDKPVVIYCQAGDRTSDAYSVLARNGFANIKCYPGGMKEWSAVKNKIEKTELSDVLI